MKPTDQRIEVGAEVDRDEATGSDQQAARNREPGPTRFWASRPGVLARCIVAGVCLAGSVPPWGWWPLAFIGIALVDRLLAGQPWKRRFARMWLVAVCWLYPAMLWMFDLTPGGYIAAGAFYSAYFGVAAALTPPDWTRRLVFPGAFAVAEVARWSWPFGGVPLAHLGLSQVETPLIHVARLAGPLLVVVCVVIIGQALSALYEIRGRIVPPEGQLRAALSTGQLRAALYGVTVVVLLVAAGLLHPRATVVDQVDVALVQGGGPQQTRASSDQEPVVLSRHVEASGAIDRPVDLIIWPENVVNPGRFLDRRDALDLVTEVAREHDAPVLAGWFLVISDLNTVNYQSVINPDGSETDRYDKVRLVPFGEYVPLRGFITSVADGVPLPRRDVLPGSDEPVLDTPVGKVGIAISWEGFFEHRSRHAVREGAELLANPTNGSSFWLTQVQTQQLASNQLRAVENDRWVTQVAPTGLSAVVDPQGEVLQRTGVGERKTVLATVEMRRGRTLASRVGWWPVVLYGLAAIAIAGISRSRPASER
ncbi:MAG: apolipoprotein N-acyltransferase [Acidimicrobiales bacterium]